VTPDEIPPENRNRMLLHIHGGCYVFFPGKAGATEAITMAGLEHFKVIRGNGGYPKRFPCHPL
jgi:epsilon-lactone hydrolase